MEAGRRRRRPSRAKRNLTTGIAVAISGGILYGLAPGSGPLERFSIAAAHLAVLLFAFTLAIGPVRTLRREPSPVSTDRRRDLGIWTAILGLVHTIAGLEVHLGGEFRRYFTIEGLFAGAPQPAKILFVASNYIGAVAAVLLLILLGLSNDLSLAKLGRDRWKRAQRTAYLILPMLIAHGAIYQLLERRAAGLVVIFAAAILSVLGLQLAGARLRSRGPMPGPVADGPQIAHVRGDATG